MRPRRTVPTSGRRGPEGREMDVMGSFDVLVFEGVVRIGPAMLAQRLELEMWVPGPIVLVEETPRICPGRAMGDIVLVLVDVVPVSL